MLQNSSRFACIRMSPLRNAIHTKSGFLHHSVSGDEWWNRLIVVWYFRENLVMKMGRLTAKVSKEASVVRRVARGHRPASVCRTPSRQSAWLFYWLVLSVCRVWPPLRSPECRAEGLGAHSLSVAAATTRVVSSAAAASPPIDPIPIVAISRALEQRAPGFIQKPFIWCYCINKNIFTSVLRNKCASSL